MAAEPFAAIFSNELREIAIRRGIKPQATGQEVSNDLLGLCLSGGGIRSATFCLGVLQALAEARLLRRLDYVSSVSGGGYIASWLAAWIARTGDVRLVEKELARPASRVEAPEVRFLRQHSNYLTPQVGSLSADTWAVIAIYLRNLLLNVSILVLSLSTILLLPLVLAAVLGILVTVSGERGEWLLASASLLVLLATFAIGSDLGIFQTRNFQAEEVHGRPGTRVWRAMHALSLHILVVAPLFATATALSLYLAFVSNAERTLGSWVSIGAAIHPLCWIVGWLGNRLSAGWTLPPMTQQWNPATSADHTTVPTAVISALISGTLLGIFLHWLSLAVSWLGAGVSTRWHVVTVGPPLIVVAILLAGVFQVGLMGNALSDAKREWLGRLGGLLLLYALIWTALFSITIYVPLGLERLWKSGWLGSLPGTLLASGTLAGWLGFTIGGILLGSKSTTVRRRPREEPESGSETSTLKNGTRGSRIHSATAIDTVVKAAPPIFALGLLALLSVFVHAITPMMPSFGILDAVSTKGTALSEGPSPTLPYVLDPISERYFVNLDQYAKPRLGLWVIVGALLALCLAWRVDINEFSMHNLYRNRLIRCYLGASRRGRQPHPFTGLDPLDDLELQNLCSRSGYHGPYQIFNASLNLVRGEELAWQKRRASSFVMTPLHCGYFRSPEPTDSQNTPNLDDHAYVPTRGYASMSQPLSVGTAMAISGAAASPNMGSYSSAALAFLLTIFNVRLGWWLPNPRQPATRASSGPAFGLLYLFFELCGMTNDRRGHVYLSDGGHFENLGLYELVRRACRTIIVCDASADQRLACDDLANAIQRCRVDFGADIKFPDGLPSFSAKVGVMQGSIRYSGGGVGTIFYIKSQLSDLATIPADVKWYCTHVDSRFPHQSTADQWFNEAQFESYRALGFSLMQSGTDKLAAALKPRWGELSSVEQNSLITDFMSRNAKPIRLDDLHAEVNGVDHMQLAEHLQSMGLKSIDGDATWTDENQALEGQP